MNAGAGRGPCGAHQIILRRRVVRERDGRGRGDVDAVRAAEVRRHTEIDDVAGVVLDDQQASGIAGHGLDGGQHRIDARRGKQIAADGGGQHAFTDKARVGRFVTGTAAGHHGAFHRQARFAQDADVASMLKTHTLEQGA